MIVYLDTSVVVSAFVHDVHSDRVRRWFGEKRGIKLSHWTITEFSSALSGLRRRREITADQRETAEAMFDNWLVDEAVEPVLASDFLTARRLLRSHVELRAPDALHLAVAWDRGYGLATLDGKLARVAAAEGTKLAGL